MWNSADFVLSKCGGAKTVARWLTLPYATVYGWADREYGVIPAYRHYDLLKAARAHGIDLTPSDFFPPKLPPVKAIKRRAAR